MGVFATGRFVPTLREFSFGDKHQVLVWLDNCVHGFARIAPDLSLYNVTPHLVYNRQLSSEFVFHASTAGISYALICVILGCIIFSRRDLT